MFSEEPRTRGVRFTAQYLDRVNLQEQLQLQDGQQVGVVNVAPAELWRAFGR